MGDSIYPSGSLEPIGVMSNSWASPTIYQPISIPIGALVEISPLIGSLWGGMIGVVIAKSGNKLRTLCKVAATKGVIELPEYSLKLLNIAK